jgi:hypothetical protein
LPAPRALAAAPQAVPHGASGRNAPSGAAFNPGGVRSAMAHQPQHAAKADRVLIEVIMEPRHAHSHRAIADVAEGGGCGTDSTVRDWMNLIRAEYLEMPGLSLTEPQVERMWNLTRDLAEILLRELQRVCFLRRTTKGTYVRADLATN